MLLNAISGGDVMRGVAWFFGISIAVVAIIAIVLPKGGVHPSKMKTWSKLAKGCGQFHYLLEEAEMTSLAPDLKDQMMSFAKEGGLSDGQLAHMDAIFEKQAALIAKELAAEVHDDPPISEEEAKRSIEGLAPIMREICAGVGINRENLDSLRDWLRLHPE